MNNQKKNDEAALSEAIKQNKNCAHYGKSLMRTLFKDYIKVVCSDELCEMRCYETFAVHSLQNRTQNKANSNSD